MGKRNEHDGKLLQVTTDVRVGQVKIPKSKTLTASPEI